MTGTESSPLQNTTQTRSPEARRRPVLTRSSSASPRRRGGWEIELFCTPINCWLGGCAPEFGRFRERVAEPPGHLVCQGWGTPCKDLKLLPLKRDREETNCPPKHRVRVRLGARAFSCCAYYPSPPLGECRMPTTISAHHGRDQVEGGVGRRATTVIVDGASMGRR